MAKAHYVGVDGVARKVTKHYVGVDGVARKVKSGYVGVNGVARQYFQSDIIWRKYNAIVKPVYRYTQTEDGIGTTGTSPIITRTSYYASLAYSFSTTKGYTTSSANTYTDPSYLIGKYYVRGDGSFVGKITAVNEVGYSGGMYDYTVDYEIVANSIETFSHNTYSRGSTSYGDIMPLDNGLPEEGTLVGGSASGSYCVLEINGNYYYYEKQ